MQEVAAAAREFHRWLNHKKDVETGEETRWHLKDLRKICATFYDEHVPESSIEILGHSVGGVTYRHDAHRAPLASRALTTLPQPSAFAAMVNVTWLGVQVDFSQPLLCKCSFVHFFRNCIVRFFRHSRAKRTNRPDASGRSFLFCDNGCCLVKRSRALLASNPTRDSQVRAGRTYPLGLGCFSAAETVFCAPV